jgi:hypothetical protein
MAILFHRERMQREDLKAKIKDKNDPLRHVLVCVMRITSFDVPSIGTVFLASGKTVLTGVRRWGPCRSTAFVRFGVAADVKLKAGTRH